MEIASAHSRHRASSRKLSRKFDLYHKSLSNNPHHHYRHYKSHHGIQLNWPVRLEACVIPQCLQLGTFSPLWPLIFIKLHLPCLQSQGKQETTKRTKSKRKISKHPGACWDLAAKHWIDNILDGECDHPLKAEHGLDKSRRCCDLIIHE